MKQDATSNGYGPKYRTKSKPLRKSLPAKVIWRTGDDPELLRKLLEKSANGQSN